MAFALTSDERQVIGISRETKFQ